MYPIYRHMDSYPQQRPYPPYHPSFESNPYQIKPDSTKSPSPYEYGPYGINNYCYPYPMEYHSCCNHNYFPGCYTFRPPYPHFPPPPPPPQPFHFHGSYAPQPHYPMEMPQRYEYDKNAPRDHHCCGCPNHSNAHKDDHDVKIEEPDPNAEKKNNDSLVPLQLENYPYPVVWIPPGYLKNKEDGKGKRVELEVKDRHQERNENSKSIEQEPGFCNGWLPLDMSKLGSLMQGGDGRKVQHQKNDEEGGFPFPIFRIPYKPEESERNDSIKRNVAQENVKKFPSHFSITPMDVSDSEDLKNKSLPRGREDNSDSVRDTIPEKVEKDGETKTLKETEGKARSIPVEFRTDNGERKADKNSDKRRSSSSSPPKSSKLPPVCLRVDPLPGKKSSSRSPSPPANKGQSEKSNSKPSNLPNMKENHQENMPAPKDVDKSKEVEQSKSKAKAIEVVENDSMNGKYGSEVLPGAKNETWGGEKCDIGEGKEENDTIKEKVDDEANKARRKNLSDDEAAVVIQSAYRGFEVRKSEPLIKLKQIAKVKDHAAELKSSIQALEASSSDIRSDDKQRMVIGETIMSLLLKLDTIQGLHPSIRDVRKSVARELVGLQEKLDSLTAKKHEVSIEETFDLSTTNGTRAVENFEPVLVDKQVCGDLENKSTKSPVANNNEENDGEHEDKVLNVENPEDLELERPDEVTCPLGTKESAISEEMQVSAELKGESGPQEEEENDKKILEEARDGPQEHLEQAQGEEVNEDKDGRTEEFPVQPLEDEASNAINVALALEAEEPKPKLPAVEENDEKLIKEDKLGAEVQQEEAQHEEFDHTNEHEVVEEEITGKIDEFPVQPLEDEVTNANGLVQAVEVEEPQLELLHVEGDNIVQPVKAEEPQVELPRVESDDMVQPDEAEPQVELSGVESDDIVQPVEVEKPQSKLPRVEIDDIVQPVEVEKPQPELPCVESEAFKEELTDTWVTKEAIDESSERKDAILVEEEKKEMVNGDQKFLADTTIEQPNNNADEFVPQGSEELMVESDRKLREENEKLKEMVEKLVEAGKEQLSAISNLSGKVKDLEKKLSKKKKLKMRKCAKRSRTYDDQMVLMNQ